MRVESFLLSIILLALLISTQLNAQEEHKSNEAEHLYKHRIAIFTGYGFIPGAVNKDGKKQLQVIPVLGFDYEYFINYKVGVGLFNDLELSSYSVEKEDDEYLQREYAFVSAVVFLYEPIIGLTLFAGPGYEFEKNQGFGLIKIGTELSKNFNEGWSIGIAASYDIKEVNSSFSFGLTAGKRLGK